VTVSFQLRTTDLAAAARYVADHNPSIRTQLVSVQLICGFLGAASLLVTAWFNRGGSLRLVDILLALGTALLAYLFSMYYFKRSYIRRVVSIASDKNPNFQRNMKYEIQAEGLAAESDLGTSTLHWSAIQHMDEDTRYIYLSLPGTSTILIPKSAFSNTAEQQAFVTALRSHLMH
jgi:YcxB-like protein